MQVEDGRTMQPPAPTLGWEEDKALSWLPLLPEASRQPRVNDG